MAVSVDGLAEQRDFPDAGLDHALDLSNDVDKRAACFLAPAIGHDAVGAEEVAAIDDRNVSRDAGSAWLLLGQVIVRQLLEVIIEIGKLGNDLLQFPEIGRIEKEIDVWKRLAELLLLAGDHAAGQHKRNLGLFSFEPGQVVQLSGHPVLGGLPHDTRVQHHDIGVIFVSGRFIADFLEHGGDFGRVGLVHLTADRPDEESLAVSRQSGRACPGLYLQEWTV